MNFWKFWSKTLVIHNTKHINEKKTLTFISWQTSLLLKLHDKILEVYNIAHVNMLLIGRFRHIYFVCTNCMY